MTHAPKIHIPGAVYYVTSRGDNNEEIFKDDKDYKMYLELLKKYKQQYGFKLFAFCLLPNHLHLLIELKEELILSEIMHDLTSNYTKYFNGKYKRKGHLFQERYKMNLLEKNAYLLYATAYIHLNPKVLGMAKETENYLYSSYSFYAGIQSKIQTPGIMDIQDETKEIIAGLKEKNYPDYLKGISQIEMNNFIIALRKKTVLGSEEFAEKVETIVRNIDSAKETEPGIKNRRFMLAGIALVLILGLASVGLYIRSLGLKKNLKAELEKKELELTKQLDEEKEFIRRDLEEKYQADRVSYNAMAKRLELEKKKARELEDKTNKR